MRTIASCIGRLGAALGHLGGSPSAVAAGSGGGGTSYVATFLSAGQY